MTAEFTLTLDCGRHPDTPALGILEARGVSLGRCPAESVTVALLGQVGSEVAASRVARAYADRGRDPLCAVPEAGDAGCVIVDHAAQSSYVITPRIGLRQVFWCAHGDRLGIASNPHGLASLSGNGARISPDAIFRYVYFHMLPGPAAVFEGVSKLDGGQCLSWNGHETTLARYWQPRFEDEATVTEATASNELHHVLHGAVAKALQSQQTAGAFLSGGLDSSTVAGMAARIRPGLPTVSMGFDARGYDEMEYARLASRRFGTRPLEYYVTPDDVLETLPAIAAAFPEPFGNSSAAAAYHCARIAREHGIELLLAGDGGDEVFGGNERYAKQLVFERYGLVPGVLRQSLLEPLVSSAARVTRRFPVGKAASYVQQAKVPLPDRLQTYNFLHQHAPHEVFAPALLERVDVAAPLRLLREEYALPDTSSAVNRMLFLDWKFTLHDNDLVKVNTMCRLGGVDVAYPMLDPTVVDFSLRIPGDWKVRNGDLRWFYKRAMHGFLPDEIIRKTKHGFGLPFGVWTRTHAGLRRLSEDALTSLGRRGYFRTEFLEEAVRLHREGHASYYGELVWILMALELWLRQHAPDASLQG